MPPKQPSNEQIQATRREGHFGESRALPPADPLTPTQMFLEITRIAAYDRNPRKERNPLYDEIKDSIRAQGGLNTPLTITRRPSEALFTVESGGNTRLQILHALWKETHDVRFYRIHCLFRPWISESHVLTAHLIENDKRGALTFIDKALGVRQLRNLLETERHGALSQRQLMASLRARGYGIDQSMISRMDYAVDVLLPLLPEALRSGTGPTQIRRIRRLENACRDVWNERGQATETFTAVFSDVLATHDGPDWELEAAQRELETHLAAQLALSLKEVRLEIDARLARGTEEQSSVPDATSTDAAPDMPTSHAHDVTRNSPSAAYVEKGTDPGNSPSANGSDSPHPMRDAPSTSTRTRGPTIDVATAARPPSTYDGPTDLTSLRSCSHKLALKIATRHGLEGCLHATDTLGMGYWMDIPTETIIPIAGRKDTVPQLCRQWLWWLLLSLSEEVVDPTRMALAPAAVLLRNLILEHNDAKALILVGEPDWKALGHELLSNPAVPEETCDDLLALIQTCRRIRRLAGDMLGAALWSTEK